MKSGTSRSAQLIQAHTFSPCSTAKMRTSCLPSANMPWTLLSPEHCALAAPRCSESDRQALSWTTSNPSAYLIDSGLWTACKELRERMERRFDTEGWRRRIIPYRETPFEKELPDAPATATFTSSGERRCFTTYPKSDLFCLQPFDFDTIDWPTIRYQVPHILLALGFRSHSCCC
ncbi:hypothetical protein QBC33DRAFT_549069 [Phialemonium atrogriseum]|uniref:Uncharacterized protein n=1 Tax=Phialemonium atrogriseum TaxID=1093897 RepID=A0AAJ0BT40_9PEZI|nr:uncharacterized protein QBC33DRAFT_549069 [Phialemonium atrogriseum]KAK1763741.1 hypothetical protein QBC33DRAFT_549069 [Phialemonium atrogriseum]